MGAGVVTVATATALMPAAPGHAPVVHDVRAAAAEPAPPPVSLPPDDGVTDNGPASVTPPVVVGRSLAGVAPAAQTVVGDLPSPALSAYQRAATIVDAADPGCHLDWSVIAAIGQVESAHGTYGGSRLDEDGRATPPIIGIALDGGNGTRRISDSDGGLLDGDKRFDRAVGPMQFIPSTWSMVAVDADGDGNRDPQDIDDAALAAGVYLCAGPGDLGTSGGLRAALLRYNRSSEYVDLVLSIARDFANGSDLVLPTATWSSGSSGPVVPVDTLAAGLPTSNPTPRMDEPRDEDAGTGPSPMPGPRPTPGPSPAPSPSPDPQDPDEGPTEEPSEEPSEEPTPKPDEPTETPSPTPDPTPTPTPEPSPEPLPAPSTEPSTEPEPAPEPEPTEPAPTEPALEEVEEPVLDEVPVEESTEPTEGAVAETP